MTEPRTAAMEPPERMMLSSAPIVTNRFADLTLSSPVITPRSGPRTPSSRSGSGQVRFAAGLPAVGRQLTLVPRHAPNTPPLHPMPSVVARCAKLERILHCLQLVVALSLRARRQHGLQRTRASVGPADGIGVWIIEIPYWPSVGKDCLSSSRSPGLMG